MFSLKKKKIEGLFYNTKSWEKSLSSDLNLRNIKENSSGWRHMIPDGNLELHKEIKRAQNCENKENSYKSIYSSQLQTIDYLSRLTSRPFPCYRS